MPDKKPIILIPGIQGTKLFDTNEKDFKVVWSGVKSNFSNIQRLALQRDGKSDRETDIVVERADVENLAYSEIVNYLRGLGYRVYIFGYDWRKSNLEAGKKLQEYVEELKDKLNENCFNFLTHSMGALVLSSYFKRLSEEEANAITNKAIFTVPPFLGSAEATFNLVIGKSKLFNSSDDFRKIARTFPAIYELLPVYEGAYLFENPARQPLLDYYDFSSYWQQIPNPDRVDTKSKQKLISDRLKALKNVRDQNDFIYDFSQITHPELKPKLLVLAGTNEETICNIGIKDEWSHFINLFDFDLPNREGDGDGTVPLKSAIAFKDSITTLGVKKRKFESWANSFFIMNDWHAFFLNNGRVQNVITRFFKPRETQLTNSSATNGMEWFQSIGNKDIDVIS